jgi:fatty-acyl-CoA synthase
VTEAAVIGVEHPKWSERPLLVVIPKDPANPPLKAAILKFLEGKIASWYGWWAIVYELFFY